MTPLDEARINVATFFKEVVRSTIYRNSSLNGIGFEELDEDLDEKVEALYERIIGNIEEQYESAQDAIDPDNGFAHAYLYYSIFSATLVAFIIGSNVR